jgi:hypothetical protein
MAGLANDEKLRTEFIKSRDVTTLSLKTVETYASSTGHQYVKALLTTVRRGMDSRTPAHRSHCDVSDHA